MKKWLGITVILSFCSIVYELLLATSLSILTGSYIWWHSWTIAFYISGLSLGSYLASKELSKNTFIKVELLLSIIGMSSLFIIYGLHWGFYIWDVSNLLSDNSTYETNNFLVKTLFFMVSQFIVFLIGSLSGYEIPLLIKKIKEVTGKDHENKVIAYNYFGTLLGTVVFSIFMYEWLNLITIGLVVGTLNFLVCIYLLFEARSFKTIGLVSGVIVLGIIGHSQVSQFEQVYFKTRYFLTQYFINKEESSLKDFLKDQAKFPEVKRVRSLYQQIDLVRSLDLNASELKMFIDNNFQFSTESEKSYHDSFAHVAINLVKASPKRILVLGAGDGMLIRELLKYESLQEIVHVELDAKIVDMFKTEPFNSLNNNSLNNPKVKTIIGDGFYYVRNTREVFDAVFIDFPYPKTYDLSRLYSIEFYQNVRRVLTKDGFAVMDAPLINRLEHIVKVFDTKDDVEVDNSKLLNNDIVMSTVYFAGFRFFQPFKIQGESFLVMKLEQFKSNYVASEEFLKYTSGVKAEELQEVLQQKFPYSIDRNNVNSIFFPKLIHGWSLAPIY